MTGYTHDYVSFFLNRNYITKSNNINEIEQNTFADSRLIKIIDDLQNWPCYPIASHKNVEHPLHRLSFIAELGFNRDDPGIASIITKILKHQSPDGPFQVLIDIPVHFGGSGKPGLTWVMSDAPVLLYSVIKLNKCEITPQIRKGVDYIANLISDNGWHCKAASDLGNFRGPGRKEDPCPYATMFSLKMLALTDVSDYQNAKEIGIRSIFSLWDDRKRTKPYLFGMGTDFKKLKLPFVWYDILNVVDTLSMYPQAYTDARFREMLDIILSKKIEKGFIPESIYLKAKEWDFGQKKVASEFMKAIIQRIEHRLNHLK